MLPNTQPAEKDAYHRDGAKYEAFRPVYPPRFIQKVREAPKAFNNYLDIATGTGQVLFQVYDRFTHLTVGADITDSVLKVAEEKGNQLKSSLKAGQEFKFVKGNCQKIDEVLKESGINNKFDLVSIGEAFHWFDMEPLLKTIKDHVLEEDGVLAILSYDTPSFELNSQDAELNKRALQAYDVFYNAIIPLAKFHVEALALGYQNVPFDKYFTTVQKDNEVDKMPGRIEDVINHFGTWSMYNAYVQKHSSDSDYKDPLQTLKETLEALVKEAQGNKSLNNNEEPVFTVMKYQVILASNRKL